MVFVQIVGTFLGVSSDDYVYLINTHTFMQ